MRGENQTADNKHLTNKCIQSDFKIQSAHNSGQ